jgi:hypothetical protein
MRNPGTVLELVTVGSVGTTSEEQPRLKASLFNALGLGFAVVVGKAPFSLRLEGTANVTPPLAGQPCTFVVPPEIDVVDCFWPFSDRPDEAFEGIENALCDFGMVMGQVKSDTEDISREEFPARAWWLAVVEPPTPRRNAAEANARRMGKSLDERSKAHFRIPQIPLMLTPPPVPGHRGVPA